MSTPAALRDYVRAKFASLVPDRPYARNIEKSVWEWAIKETRKARRLAVWENRWFRSAYKLKAVHLLAELQRAPCVSCNLAVGPDGRVKVDLAILPQLQRRIFAKELKSSELVDMPPDVLWPDGPYSQVAFRQLQKALANEAAKSKDDNYEGILKCGKCKSRKTSYYQLQTRSADEPMVRFFLVLACAFLTPSTDNLCHLQGLRTQVEVLLKKYFVIVPAWQAVKQSLTTQRSS